MELLSHFRQSASQLKFADIELDGYFPQTRNAQENVVRGLFYQQTCIITESRVVLDEPEKAVRVEQQLHSMYSLKSSSGASKSSLI
jgi:hypothetical protein